MSTFGEGLPQSLEEAVAHAKGNGPAILHTLVTPRGSEASQPHAGAGASVRSSDRYAG